MQGAGWIDLIRRIPAKMRDSLCFATVNGSEIMSQDILRLDREFVLMRGRMAGSQEVGKIIILPYDQIVNIAVNRILKDEDVQNIFGKASPLPVPVEAAVADPDPGQAGDELFDPTDYLAHDAPLEEHEILAEESGEEAAVNLTMAHRRPAKDNAPNNARPAEISKSVLLARLRQRLAEQGKQQS